MQTVNFQCGHCGNLMAVSVEYLGQQVRCPTCQQVVLAPAVSTHLSSDSGMEPPISSNEESESLFPQWSEATTSLPANSEVPSMELAPQPTAPEALSSFAEETLPTSPQVRSQTEENGEGTLPWQVPNEPTPSELPVESPLHPVTPRPTKERKMNLVFPLVIVPLLLYAVAATAVAAYTYMRLQAVPPSLFDQLPDIEGDTPGVRKEGKRVHLPINRDLALQPLPEHLLVPLHESIQVGDLLVKPRRVERRKISLLAEAAPDRPEQSPHDALVLTLELTNTAEDYAFTPLDNYFDRAYKPGQDQSVPLTVLQAGQEAFFGGPAKWSPLNHSPNRRRSREWLVGRKNYDPEGLAPGQTMETIVATDGWNPAVAAYLFGDSNKPGYEGKLLWRVQLRRGLIEHRGKRYPATAVIGVQFDHRAF